MLASHPREALVLAKERARRLREETVADHLRPASGVRRALAASLRRAANCLDRTPLAYRTA
jgi:hypothetical protein